MRSLADGRSGRFIRISAALSALLALGACGMFSGSSDELQATAAVPSYGPQGDYPVVVGDPYTVAGATYTPEDVMNYDQVGYLAADQSGGNAVTGSHHTLPLPSYVEVTSLETGRTVLVRLERRGPMNSQEVVALSPGALTQLGGTRGTPVRVRRVNPPEDQRALLRAGQQAELRMDTPMSLVEILKRKLPGQTVAPAQAAPSLARPVQTAPITPTLQPAGSVSAPALPPLPQRGVTPVVVSSSSSRPVATQASSPVTVRNGFVVQAAAFSSEDRANNAARTLEGDVSQSGSYFRVRTGPFATRGEAEASLAKVRAAGYTDARIFTSG